MTIARVAANTWLFADTGGFVQPSVAKAFATNVTAGSLLVAFSGVGTADQAITFSDGVNTWVTSGATRWSSILGVRIAIGYAVNAAAGATTVTASGGADQIRFIGICEYTGCATASPVDGTPVTGNNDSGSDSTVTPGTITSTGEAVFISAATIHPTAITAGGTFTEQYDAVPSGFYAHCLQDEIVSGAQTNYSLAWSAGTQKGYWSAVGIAFKTGTSQSNAPRAMFLRRMQQQNN